MVRAEVSMTGTLSEVFSFGDRRWIERTMMAFWADGFGAHLKDTRQSQTAAVWKT